MEGFIITRHVNSDQTNKYWNLCIQSIRRFYSAEKYKIVVIDDNSNPLFLKQYQNQDQNQDQEYKNVIYIQSEFPGRGELLPYYYFYKNPQWFKNAIIIHDSVFFQKKINFHKIVAPVLPFWHFNENKQENKQNSIFLSNYLKNNHLVQKELSNSDPYLNLNLKINSLNWTGCFGVQTFINYGFLSHLQNKYNLFNLLKVVKKRSDRCCLERIMGVLFYLESPNLKKIHSLLGDIFTYYKWEYTFDEYRNDLRTDKKIMHLPLVKVWTGR